MPDDYYVSQYSGEEIDERLTAAHNAVRYDAAQTLTDAQKTQARANINAAPGGFGLGGIVANIPAGANLNDYILTGFFGSVDTSTITTWVNVPPNWPANEAILEVYTLGSYAIQHLSSVTTKVSAQRSQRNNAWDEWEWVNPPMQLGVEYRTTERYLWKPVYRKLIWGGALPNTGYSNVDIASGCIIVQAACYATSATSASEVTPSTIVDVIPWNNNDDNGINMSAFKNHVNLWCKINRSSSNFVAYLWYIKDTD